MNPLLQPWSNFYVITGSASAALTGLMFVVITLVAGRERSPDDSDDDDDGVAVFSSPTVVHFCAALLVSVVLAAPWHGLAAPSVILALTGLYGVVYASFVLARIRRMGRAYVPQFDDWFWYAIVPLAAYAAIFGCAIALERFAQPILFALAAATILLIFIGIRNAWDTVTYIAVK